MNKRIHFAISMIGCGAWMGFLWGCLSYGLWTLLRSKTDSSLLVHSLMAGYVVIAMGISNIRFRQKIFAGEATWDDHHQYLQSWHQDRGVLLHMIRDGFIWGSLYGLFQQYALSILYGTDRVLHLQFWPFVLCGMVSSAAIFGLTSLFTHSATLAAQIATSGERVTQKSILSNPIVHIVISTLLLALVGAIMGAAIGTLGMAGLFIALTLPILFLAIGSRGTGFSSTVDDRNASNTGCAGCLMFPFAFIIMYLIFHKIFGVAWPIPNWQQTTLSGIIIGLEGGAIAGLVLGILGSISAPFSR